MICFITTSAHCYTLHELEDVPGMPELRFMSYNGMLRKRHLPAATYIFADLDRLGYWHLELAARVFRLLRSKGLTVLNDPARLLFRYPLLKRLKASGLNSFEAWDAAVDGLPDRYPVFLRTKAAHRGTLSALLHSPAEAEAKLDDLIADGYCLNDLMFIEFCAEPIQDGLYRKLSAFRIGDQVVTGMSVHEHAWHAKNGELGAATPELYQEEYENVDNNHFGEQLAPYFHAANIEFGRVDFALVQGRIEVYEINTNPHVSLITDHPNPMRNKADALYHERLANALQQIDAPKNNQDKIALNSDVFVEQRRRDRLVLRERWAP